MSDEMGISATIDGDASGFTAAIDQAESALDGLSSTLAGVSTDVESWGDSIDDIGVDFENLSAPVSDLGDDFDNTAEKANTGISGIVDGLKSWGLNLDTLYDKGNDVFKKFGVNVDDFAAKLGTTGPVLTAIAAIGAVVVEVGKKLIEFGEQFDEVNETIAKGTGATGDALAALNSDFNKLLSSGVEQPIGDLSQAFADLNTKMGLTGTTLVDTTKNIADFADVTKTSVTTAVSEVTNITNKWGLSLEQMPELMDELTVASQNSGASAESLSQALITGQATLSQFGYSITDSLAMLGSFAKEGVNTTTVLTAMRTALSYYSSNNIEANEGLKKTIETIQNAKTNTEALSEAVTVFGSKAGAEMVKALQSGDSGIAAFQAALENAQGAVEATAEASDTLGDKQAVLGNKMKAMFESLGTGAVSAAKDVIDIITDMADEIEPVVKPIVDVIGSAISSVFAIIKSVFTAVKTIFDQWDVMWSSAGAYVGAVATTVTGLLGDIVNIVSSAVGLVASLLTGNWTRAWQQAQLIVLSVVDAILTYVSGLANSVTGIINVIISKANIILSTFGKAIPQIGTVALSETTGLTAKIKSLTADLAKDTKSKSDETKISLKTNSDSTVTTAKTNAAKITNNTKEEAEKQEKIAKEKSEFAEKWDKTVTSYNETQLKAQQKAAVEDAEKKGVTKKELSELLEDYDDQYLDAYKKSIEEQRSVSLKEAAEKGADAETVAEINEYYNDKITDYEKEQVTEREKTLSSYKTYYKSFWEGISDSWGTWLTKLTTDIQDAANDWSDVFDTVKSSLVTISEGALEAIGKTLAGDSDAWSDYANVALEALAQVLTALGAQLSALAAAALASEQYGKAAAYAAAAAAAFVASGVVTALISAASASSEAASSADELADSLENLTDLDTVVSTYTSYFSEATGNIEDYEEALTEAQEAYDEASAQMTTTTASNSTVLGNYTLSWLELLVAEKNYAEAKAYRANLITEAESDIQDSIDTTTNAIASYIDIFTSADMATLNYLSSLEKVTAAEESFYASLEDASTDIIDDLVDNLENGLTESDFMSTMEEYITNLVIQAAVYTDSLKAKLASIGAAIADGIASGLTSADMSSLIAELAAAYEEASATATAASTIVSEAFSLAGYADGTDSATTGVHLVGEQGPELVYMQGGETVVPASQTASILSGGSSTSTKNTTVNYTFNSPTALNASQMVSKMKSASRTLAAAGVF